METLHPGLYLLEEPGENPIEGVSTSTTAFVGVTEKGPVGESVFVTSWKEYQEIFGGLMKDSYLPYAVKGFFENKGKRLFISRVVKYENMGGTFVKKSKSAKGAVNSTEEEGPKPLAQFVATSDGTWGNDVEVEVAASELAEEEARGKVTIVVYEDGVAKERFKDLDLAILDIELKDSKLVKCLDVAEDIEELPLGKIKLSGGEDGIGELSDADYLGDEALGNGLHAFDKDEIRLLAIPGATSKGVLKGIETYVDNRTDVFGIICNPLGITGLKAVDYIRKEANVSSKRLGYYVSWLEVTDPIGIGKNPTKMIPNVGHVAGLFARTDSERGVWKAPAGIEAKLRGVVGLEDNVNDATQDMMNPYGVNAIRAFDGEGIVVWGARTLSDQSEWRYIPVRRSADYVGNSILAGTRWAVFEPNDEPLWNKITMSAEAFLRGFHRAGGLRGKTPSEAFFVECNSNTTTKDDIDNGRLFANIGAAYQKPAEFVIFRLSII